MWPNPQFPADLVTFTEKILNGKLHFLCSEMHNGSYKIDIYKLQDCIYIILEVLRSLHDLNLSYLEVIFITRKNTRRPENNVQIPTQNTVKTS